MDIIGALTKYRMSVLQNKTAFNILHFIYRDEFSVDKELESEIGLSSAQLRQVVRDLHQANLVRTSVHGILSLTKFAERVLAGLGADKLIIPFLLDSLIPEMRAPEIKKLAEWVLQTEPERAPEITASLRNLKFYRSYRPLESNDVLHYLLMCISPSFTKSHHLLRSEAVAVDFFINFSGHQLSDEHNWAVILKEYVHATDMFHKSDVVFIDACRTPDIEIQIESKMLEVSSFRTFNYLRSLQPDYILESCVEQMIDDRPNKTLKMMWLDLKHVWSSARRKSGSHLENLESDLDFAKFLNKSVSTRANVSPNWNVISLASQLGVARLPSGTNDDIE